MPAVLSRLSEILDLPEVSIEAIARACYEQGVVDARTEVAEQAPQMAVTS